MMHHGAGDGQPEEDTFGALYDRRVVSRIVPYILLHRHLAKLAILAILVYTGTMVTIPWLIKLGIDGFIAKEDFSGLTWLFVLFMGMALLNWGSNYVSSLAMAKVSQGVLYTLRRQMFSHLQSLSMRFYDRTEVGRIMSRVQGDVYQLQEFMTMVVTTLGDILSLLGIVVVLLLMNLKLGLISMAVLPILIGAMAIWEPYAKRAFMRVRRAASTVNASLNEDIAGVRVVQSMNREDRNLELFGVKTRESLVANMAATRLSAGLLPPVDVLTAVAIGLALYFGSQMITSDQMEIGALIAFVMYIQRFFDPIRDLTLQYTQLQRSMASGARVFNLLDTKPDITDTPNAQPIPSLKGEIEFRDVSFSYVAGEEVLRNVSLHIGPGETVAIVGATGAGKTTLVSLLSRFYDVPLGSGAILVDGCDIRGVTHQSLASQMSMVLQEPFLFSGTVKENIKYNHQGATDEEMVEAAKAVGAHDFITRLESRYDTELKERGVNLSVGQRQLISLARAVVVDPRVLILDEATANIDSYTELLIQRALQRLLKGRTAVVIAHRLSTIHGADKIIVLDQGQVVEEGTHEELLGNGGLYAHLYQLNYATMEESQSLAGSGT